MNKKILTAGLALAALVIGIFVGTLPERAKEGYPLSGHVYPTPNGGSLDLSVLKGKKVVVNFWATWCPPCVEEMPELSGMYDSLKARHIELIGVAVDNEGNVKPFLEKHPVKYPVVIAGFAGTDLTTKLGDTQGGLPFTVILDEDGNVIMKKAGRIHPEEIESALSK